MIAISVLMPTYNAAKYVAEAVESVIKQSFTDWELVVVDDGSTDETIEIIRSFSDERIKLICNNHDFIGSLNVGLKESSGKYIARMDADDVMHPDRLKIQYNIMETESEITVCGSWMLPILNNKIQTDLISSFIGVIKNPIIQLLKDNLIFHPTAFIRHSFLKDNLLFYEPYIYAEDYKLWFEIAKKGGVFYVESLPLLFYRFNENQVSKCNRLAQEDMSWIIKQEILRYLLRNYRDNDVVVCSFCDNLVDLVDKKVFSKMYASNILYNLITSLKEIV